MIKLVYKDEKLWDYRHVLWATSVFLINSAIFEYIIILVCFFPLFPRPPLYLTIILLAPVLADRLYIPITTKAFLTVSCIVDLLIWLMLLLSLVLPADEESTVMYLGLPVVVYLYDIVYLKQVLFDLVRRNYWVYKIYILVKITYWIILYAHFIGCIFYAIDEHLISISYFGDFATNPSYYYQGQLLAYTPIYMFDGVNRYVYAMYYSFALVSTIAFGDIVGKNYFEDIYVMILIILSTIVISLVIEQMYIIFRRRKTRLLELLNKVRFLSERLKGYREIPETFREEIINYLIDSNWRQMNEYPLQLNTVKQFKTKIISQSIIANPDLPVFYSKYLLHKVNFKHIPQGLFLISNTPNNSQLVSFMATEGTFWIGHQMSNHKTVGGYEVKQPGFNFGIEETLAGTNSLYPHLAIRTVTPATVLRINRQQIQQILEQLQRSQFPCDKPIEHYQIAKDKAIFTRNKYLCSVCSKDTAGYRQEHTLLTCSKVHLVISEAERIYMVNRTQERKYAVRLKLRQNKIRGVHLEAFEEEKRSQRLMEIQRFRNIVKKIRDPYHEKQKSFEHWFKWQVYGSDLEFFTDFHSHKHIKANIFDDFNRTDSLVSPKMIYKMSPKKMAQSIYHSQIPLRSIHSQASRQY